MIQCLSTSYPNHHLDNHQVVLHMSNKNDLVVCLDAPVGEDRVGELAAILATVRGSVVDCLTKYMDYVICFGPSIYIDHHQDSKEMAQQ